MKKLPHKTLPRQLLMRKHLKTRKSLPPASSTTSRGGATTGALSMALNVGARAPHGGIFVFFAIDPLWGWIVALLAGIVVSTIAVILLKQFWPNEAIQKEAAKAESHKVTA